MSRLSGGTGFGWRYDITADGIVRTPPAGAGQQVDLSLHRSDYVILALLVAVATSVIFQITVTLINALLDEQIWSQTFERDFRDVLLLQNEVARAIAQQVEVTVKPQEQDQLDRVASIDPAAFEAYLKGKFHIERFTPQDMQLAAQYFQQAVNLDPDHALAYATHMTWLQYDWEEAEVAFRRAIDLNPSLAEARMFYSHHLSLLGRTDEGAEQMQLAVELDPLNPFVRGLHGE